VKAKSETVYRVCKVRRHDFLAYIIGAVKYGKYGIGTGNLDIAVPIPLPASINVHTARQDC
jgi:hypothetical protein